MAEFKVGDRVKIIGDSARTGRLNLLGKEVTIIDIDSNLLKTKYFINERLGSGNGHYFLFAEDMQLVKPKLNISSFAKYLESKVLHVK